MIESGSVRSRPQEQQRPDSRPYFYAVASGAASNSRSIASTRA
jgi:hypothetical protein